MHLRLSYNYKEIYFLIVIVDHLLKGKKELNKKKKQEIKLYLSKWTR